MKNLFIMSSQRSGSNWLHRCLDEHDSIRINGELMPSEILTILKRIKCGDHVSQEKLSKSDAFRNAARTYVDALMDENLVGKAGDCDESSYRVDKSAYSCVQSIRKHPSQIEYMSILQEYYAEAKKILIIRDPRDVIVSYSEWKGQRTGSLLSSTPRSLYYFIRHAKNWHILNKKWISDAEGDKDCLIVKYDDIKLRFEETLREVFDFLELPVNNEFIIYLKDNYYCIDSDKYKEENKNRGYGFFRKGELGEWKLKFKWYHRIIYRVLCGGKSEYYEQSSIDAYK